MKKLILILLLLPIYTVAQSTFGNDTPLSKIYISLLKKDSSNKYANVDCAAVAFRSDFGNKTYGPQDAIKIGSEKDNLYISDKGKSLSIDGRLPATDSDIIQLSISKVSGKNYQLVVDVTNYISNGVSPYLVDNYKGNVKSLSSNLNIIDFIVDSIDTNSYSNRFLLTFKPTTLPINSIVLNTTISDNNVIINWNTTKEINVSYFVIEKSYDGVSFTNICIATAKNTNTASYAYIDNNINNNTVIYYRIKSIDEDGETTYSPISVVNNMIFNIYPNPVINVLHIQPNNYMIGNSIILIYSISGKLVLSTNFIFNKLLSINLDNIAHGEYILQIFSNNKLYTKKFIK